MEPAPPSRPVAALELFSGLGGFAAAARPEGIAVAAAFDQFDRANDVYERNFGHRPRGRNLDSISSAELPSADLWWMSPPCTPYTKRGKRRDADDPRAASLANLLDRIGEIRPANLLLENVPEFGDSQMHERLRALLDRGGWRSASIELCPTRFGIPMKRRRLFLAASLEGEPRLEPPRPRPILPLRDFLDPIPAPELEVDPATVDRYRPVIHLVDPDSSDAIVRCTTHAYAGSPVRSGSLIALGGGRFRRLSPSELLRLFGFPPEYSFPPELSPAAGWRMAGNSVCVRAARWLIRSLPRYAGSIDESRAREAEVNA
jgi:site-specific DNA-cytosine methylase